MAGSVDITGVQHYTGGVIGHPETTPSGEASPAYLQTDTPAGGITTLIGRNGVAVSIQEKQKVPVGSLVPVLAASSAIPMSVGDDGMVYGSAGLWSRQLVRSSDSMATVENGVTLATGSYVGVDRSIIYATKTREGYVAVATCEQKPGAPGAVTDLAAGAEIWFSERWDSGWAKVADIGRTLCVSVSRPVVSRVRGGTVLLVGEYSNTNGVAHKLYATTNGGKTWSVVFNNSAVNTSAGVVNIIDDIAKNAHVHGSCYDARTDRLYVSCGDFDNSFFGYSEDFGVTWVPQPAVAVGTNNAFVYHQPVLVHPSEAGILTTPDSTAGYAGVWVVDRITGVEVPAVALGTISPADQFAQAPIADNNAGEFYVMHPMTGARSSGKYYITASGDGGRSWYKVFEAAQGSTEYFDRGIVGPDARGNLILHKRTWDGVSPTATAATYTMPVMAWREFSLIPKQSAGLIGIQHILMAQGLLKAGQPVPFDASGATVNVGNLNVNAAGAKITVGGASGIAVLDTSSGASLFRQLFNGNMVAEYTATSAYGQVEYKATVTYLKFTGTTGGMIATQASQKIAFWGATPVVRPTGTPAAATDLATALTLLNDIRTKLITIGLIA